MAATVVVVEKNGTAGAATTKGTGTKVVRFKQADNATVDANNPIPVPASGLNYSYAKSLSLKVTATGGYSTLDNFKMYSDGANPWTGVTVLAKAIGTYAQATNASAVTGMTDIFTGYPTATPLALTGSKTSGTGEMGQIALLQMSVGPTASAGNLADENITFSYDEV